MFCLPDSLRFYIYVFSCLVLTIGCGPSSSSHESLSFNVNRPAIKTDCVDESYIVDPHDNRPAVLSLLEGYATIEGSVKIENASEGLEKLRCAQTINGHLTIRYNPKLRTLHGLRHLKQVSGSINIYDNDLLVALDMPQLVSANHVAVFNNKSITAQEAERFRMQLAKYNIDQNIQSNQLDLDRASEYVASQIRDRRKPTKRSFDGQNVVPYSQPEPPWREIDKTLKLPKPGVLSTGPHGTEFRVFELADKTQLVVASGCRFHGASKPVFAVLTGDKLKPKPKLGTGFPTLGVRQYKVSQAIRQKTKVRIPPQREGNRTILHVLGSSEHSMWAVVGDKYNLCCGNDQESFSIYRYNGRKWRRVSKEIPNTNLRFFAAVLWNNGLLVAQAKSNQPFALYNEEQRPFIEIVSYGRSKKIPIPKLSKQFALDEMFRLFKYSDNSMAAIGKTNADNLAIQRFAPKQISEEIHVFDSIDMTHNEYGSRIASTQKDSFFIDLEQFPSSHISFRDNQWQTVPASNTDNTNSANTIWVSDTPDPYTGNIRLLSTFPVAQTLPLSWSCVTSSERHCESPCYEERRCEYKRRRCIATDKYCQDSSMCKVEGRCVAQNGACIASREQDCLQSDNCKTNGACALGQTRCVPTTNKHCARLDNCKEHGLCTARNGDCVAETDKDCKPTDNCKRSGLCSAVNGQCIALTKADCEASVDCKKGNLCTPFKGRCVLDCTRTRGCQHQGLCKRQSDYPNSDICIAHSEADCQASAQCLDNGHCSLAHKACVAASNDDCQLSALCTVLGRCSFQNGSCVAAEDVSCRKSQLCSFAGKCNARNGVCIAASTKDCQASDLCKISERCDAKAGECRH